MKKRNRWKKLLLVGVLGGSFLFQAPTCTERAAWVTAFSSAITAGGVLYLVERVIND
jgi:hypoxanthine-guanine phosphoribosyltransferase